MKTLLRPVLLFTALLLTPFCNAQENENILTEDDWNKIIPYLVEEDWVNAEKLSADYLSRFKGEDEMSDEAGIVRYMYLKSVAALLGSKEISKEEALKKVAGFEGKIIVTPYSTFKQKGMFNYLNLKEDKTGWHKCSSNNDATEIHMFETYKMSDKTLIEQSEKYEGKSMRLSAIIKEIKAEGFAMPRFDVTFSATEIWEMQE